MIDSLESEVLHLLLYLVISTYNMPEKNDTPSSKILSTPVKSLPKLQIIKYYLYVCKVLIKKQKRSKTQINKEYNSGSYLTGLGLINKVKTLDDMRYLMYDRFYDSQEAGYVLNGKWCLLDQRIFLDISEDQVQNFILKFVKDTDTILELGCGNGKHLFELRNRGFKGNLYGFELSKNAIELAKTLDEKFKTNINFQVFDITQKIPDTFTGSTIFTVGVTEQIKYDIDKVIENIIAINPKQVIHMEDVHELSKFSIRKLFLSLYAYAQDYNTQLIKTLKKHDLDILEIEMNTIQAPVQHSGLIRWIPHKKTVHV